MTTPKLPSEPKSNKGQHWKWGWYTIYEDVSVEVCGAVRSQWLSSIRAIRPGGGVRGRRSTRRPIYYPTWSVSKADALWYRRKSHVQHLINYFSRRYPERSFLIHYEPHLAHRKAP